MSDLYFCPTAGEVESAAHGGFEVCCDRPGLHLPMPDSPATAAVSAALSEAAKVAFRVSKVREYCEALAGGSCRVQAAVTARDVLDLLDGRLGAEDGAVPPAAGSGADGEQQRGYAGESERNPDGTCPDWCPCHRMRADGEERR